MSIHDDARAASEAVYDAALSGLEAHVSALSGELALSESRLTAVESELTRVRAEFDAYKATHPDEVKLPPRFIPGASYGYKADKSRYAGRSEAARIFIDGSLPADVTTDGMWKRAYSEGNRVMVVSWKGAQTGEQVAAAFSNVPADVTVYGCYWHEPEDNIAKGDITLADWRARTIEHAAAMRSVGVVPTVILMAYTLNAGSGRNVMDYGNTRAEVVAFDYYMNPAKGKDDPEGMVDRMLFAARSMGAKSTGVAETGVPNAVAETTAVDLVKRLRTKLAATDGVLWGTFWSSGEFAFTDATATAWFGA